MESRPRRSLSLRRWSRSCQRMRPKVKATEFAPLPFLGNGGSVRPQLHSHMEPRRAHSVRLRLIAWFGGRVGEVPLAGCGDQRQVPGPYGRQPQRAAPGEHQRDLAAPAHAQPGDIRPPHPAGAHQRAHGQPAGVHVHPGPQHPDRGQQRYHEQPQQPCLVQRQRAEADRPDQHGEQRDAGGADLHGGRHARESRSWNLPMALARLAKQAKTGVRGAGGFPMEFGTISVSDGISMGHVGMHYSLPSREVIADSVETVMEAERLDGAATFLYAGTTMPGRLGDRDITIIDAFEGIGACVMGRMTRAELDEIEKHFCPSEGACGGMYTANTMASAAEALGMALPGSTSPPAPDGRRDVYAERTAEAVVERGRRRLTARQIMTREAFENAIAVVMALGGSTNAVLHLLAIAHEARVELT